jgi:DedD protein
VTEPHHEPSYYEIALTNRQVVVAFVVLLVCLLSAFFSGVWIGRGSAERNPGETQVARVASPSEPTEGRNLEELKFFSEEANPKRRSGKGRSDAAAPSPANPPVSASGATAAPDAGDTAPPAGRGAQVPAPPVADPAEGAPPPAAPPASRRRAPAPSSPSSSSPSSSNTERPPERAASTAPDTDPGAVVRSRRLPDDAAPREADAGSGRSAAAQPGAGATVIQVFASADSNEANKMRDRLSRGGEPAFVSPLTVDGRTMYRVRVGPFPTRARAQKEADRVRRAYKLDTWLTE